jgi:hypothetical protein
LTMFTCANCKHLKNNVWYCKKKEKFMSEVLRCTDWEPGGDSAGLADAYSG